jgi:hypothetical protein
MEEERFLEWQILSSGKIWREKIRMTFGFVFLPAHRHFTGARGYSA